MRAKLRRNVIKNSLPINSFPSFSLSLSLFSSMTDFIIIFLFVATTAAHPRRCPIILISFFHFYFMRLWTRRTQREMEEKDRKQFNSLFHVKSADSSVVGRKSFSLFPNSISKYQAIYLNAKVDITFSKKRVGQICYTFTLFRMTHLGQIKNIFMSFNRFPFLTFTFFYLKLVTSSPKIKNDTGISYSSRFLPLS